MAEDSKTPVPIDWQELRKKSISPGGFGKERESIWPKLLHVKDSDSQPLADTETSESHRDEHQIRLDTDRSFVLTSAAPEKSRESLQEDLHRLLVSVFRKRPKLHYFQGYHDIVTVLFLTLPSNGQLRCVEKLSLHRVRDSMGSTLEPVVGLLKFMKSLFRVVDPEFSAILEENTPLPYFALSNLLTLFSHDMPTLPLIQHVFDYLLCRPPIMVVYLAIAVTLSRKARNLTDQEESHTPVVEQTEPSDVQLGIKAEETANDISIASADDATIVASDASDASTSEAIEAEATLIEDAGDVKDVKSDDQPHLDEPQPVTEKETETAPSEHSNTPQEPSKSPSQSQELPAQATKLHKPAIPLSTLLQQSDTLYEQYPPNHPSLKLKLSDIMGPQSVVFTWSENESDLPSDDSAERMVDYPQLVVYPVDDSLDDENKEGDDDSDTAEYSHSEKRKRRNKLRKRRRPFGKGVLDLRDRRTMVAGAVLVLGVAMAVYGVKYGPVGDVRGSPHGLSREWKKIGGWVYWSSRGNR
ncbi:GTPase-activating protein gyp8 [Paramarasmius palmivorus]|uniref:GTPase-activating protein gyp8 n=1 Tax=Paramarasmius palmivorus TaxID=297713 RepID=A0AAW0D7W6_9AGAR